jgi:hypothetical protein
MVTESEERIVAVAKLAEKEEHDEAGDEEFVDDLADAEPLGDDGDQ